MACVMYSCKLSMRERAIMQGMCYGLTEYEEESHHVWYYVLWIVGNLV
jgi:hypothetical protein